MTRPSWDEYALGIAKASSARADCKRSLVGAVILDREQIVVSTGYNGTLKRAEPGCLSGACPRGLLGYSELAEYSDYSNCIGVHAEANALRWAREAGQQRRLVGATAYVTREPCPDCYELLDGALLAGVVWPEGQRAFARGGSNV